MIQATPEKLGIHDPGSDLPPQPLMQTPETNLDFAKRNQTPQTAQNLNMNQMSLKETYGDSPSKRRTPQKDPQSTCKCAIF